MKDYTKRNASYRGIPCWYNPINDEITPKNKFYSILIDIVLWIDVNILMIKEFPIWVEVDELEK
jgi:hypothetical protein